MRYSHKRKALRGGEGGCRGGDRLEKKKVITALVHGGPFRSLPPPPASPRHPLPFSTRAPLFSSPAGLDFPKALSVIVEFPRLFCNAPLSKVYLVYLALLFILSLSLLPSSFKFIAHPHLCKSPAYKIQNQPIPSQDVTRGDRYVRRSTLILRWFSYIHLLNIIHFNAAILLKSITQATCRTPVFNIPLSLMKRSGIPILYLSSIRCRIK